MSRPETLFSKLFRKQKGNCYICGNGMNRTDKSKDNFATIDHVLPLDAMRKMGISHLANNKKLACYKCNQDKRNLLPEQYAHLNPK